MNMSSVSLSATPADAVGLHIAVTVEPDEAPIEVRLGASPIARLTVARALEIIRQLTVACDVAEGHCEVPQ